MRKIMTTVALMALSATLAVGCGDDAAAEPEDAGPTEPSTVTIAVSVETDSGLIGRNYDDDVCVFAEPEYELRDEAATIIDVGRWEDEGASAGTSQWAAVGDVLSQEPYRCVLNESLTVDAAEFYTLTVTAGGSSGEVTFEQAQAFSVTVELN